MVLSRLFVKRFCLYPGESVSKAVGALELSPQHRPSLQPAGGVAL